MEGSGRVIVLCQSTQARKTFPLSVVQIHDSPSTRFRPQRAAYVAYRIRGTLRGSATKLPVRTGHGSSKSGINHPWSSRPFEALAVLISTKTCKQRTRTQVTPTLDGQQVEQLSRQQVDVNEVLVERSTDGGGLLLNGCRSKPSRVGAAHCRQRSRRAGERGRSMCQPTAADPRRSAKVQLGHPRHGLRFSTSLEIRSTSEQDSLTAAAEAGTQVASRSSMVTAHTIARWFAAQSDASVSRHVRPMSHLRWWPSTTGSATRRKLLLLAASHRVSHRASKSCEDDFREFENPRVTRGAPGSHSRLVKSLL